MSTPTAATSRRHLRQRAYCGTARHEPGAGAYGVIDRATGLLGVVGPLRMSYGRTMEAVRFVAALMSEMVEDIYGPQS